MNKYRVLKKSESLVVLTILFLRLFIALLVRGQYRSRDEVRSDYDQGSWKEVLDRRQWLKNESLQDYLTLIGRDDLRFVKIDNQLLEMQTQEYYKFRLKKINDVISEYNNGDCEICELGSGFGFNLLSLWNSGHYEKLHGFDISENALLAASLICKHFNIKNIDFKKIDLTNPADASWVEIRNKTVFTYYCLEQLKHSLSDVLENIIKSGAKRVIHLEPTTELLDLRSIKDLINYVYIKRRDYLDRLLTHLEQLEREGKVRIIERKRMYYSPTPKNDPTLIVWEPAS